PLTADLLPREFLFRYCNLDCMMHPAAWLVPRAVAEAAGPWNETLSLNDDGEYFARVVLASHRVVHCGEARSYYRSGLPGSLSAQHSRRHLESALHAAVLIGRHLRAASDDEAASRTAAANLLQRFAYDYYPREPDLVARAERAARELGGSHLAPLGGRSFQFTRRLLGWKLARRLQLALGRHPNVHPAR
ncbi:MAG TPA: hypothetical protein VGD81_20735, partial [Opitutaceae bacterium]